MNGNAELLNFIYQNSQMGVDTLRQIIDKAQPGELRELLQKQYNEYDSIHMEAKKLLTAQGLDEKGLSKLEELKTYMAINMQTMNDRSDSHLAEMLVIGGTMGIIESIQKQRRYRNAEQDILHLMKRLQKFEEMNTESLKKFL